MTFEEVFDQTVAMLQRRGRIAYSALKRQFDLDDDPNYCGVFIQQETSSFRAPP